ncbi:MAG: hypothetical protein ACTHLW_19125 [Verrucomicrobiota bacterium]
MNRFKKVALLVLAAALLVGASRVQNSLNRDREQLGLTIMKPLENAPPVLAFTTVALGGFRGLISNMLWIRANDLQLEDKFFEMAQLADWITKLEPHFSTVWTHQAWNMAYNISVKFKQSAPGEYPDRWRWVKRGFELLRDEGLVYNPNDVGIHQQLAWIFQHKMGANLDDANMYYKQEWMKEMTAVLGDHPQAGFDDLIHPKTDDEKRRAALLKEKYKMDPAFMKEVDERYGPLEWRLPEAHAIYWAAQGLKRAKENPTKVNPNDLIQLRRAIYQSMLLSFQRGRLITNALAGNIDLGPNLDIIPRVNAAYENNMEEDEGSRANISNGHRSFLRQAVYSLYVNNRISDAAKWFKYLGEKYPDKPVIDGKPNSLPRNLTLEEYALSNLQIDINETSRDRVKTAIEGFLIQSYTSLILGDSDRAAGFRLLANKVWEKYRSAISEDRWPAIGLPTVKETSETILNDMLNPDNGVSPEARARLRTELNLPAESTASTNAVNSANLAK